jgi:hypothetical protein
MKIDFDHWLGNQIANAVLNKIEQESSFQLVAMLKPKLTMDGNMFCFIYGELPNDCVVGFGETAAQAAYDFNTNWYNYKAHGYKKHTPKDEKGKP